MIVQSPVPFRAAGWTCVALITYLSLVPQEMEVRTTLPAGVEHLIAYAGAAALLRLGHPRQGYWTIAAALFIYSAGLELLQAFSPGRHPGLGGAIWSGIGAFIGGGGARSSTG